jgi:hypothetical protein
VGDLDPQVRVGQPPEGGIALQWEPLPNTRAYLVRRRLGPGHEWLALALLPSNAHAFDDPHPAPGEVFEYHVGRVPVSGPPGNAYVFAGHHVPFRDRPGAVLVVYDRPTGAAITDSLDRLLEDLRDDGYRVVREAVEADWPPARVRERIREVHARTLDLRAVLLLGQVPRPFSGLISPDGHTDHRGAWPADGYYADLDGHWTDLFNLGGAAPFENRAGDGKFDPSTYPTPLELAVGRIDASELPALGEPAEVLLARYLDANHAYRKGALRLARRTWLTDNFGYFGGEAFARAAYRTSAAAFGPGPSSGPAFLDALEEEEGYALAFGCGAGTPDEAQGVARSADFAHRAPQTALMGLFGSYFGDWSYPDNLLRAALFGQGAVLSTLWFSRPYAHLHGLGALRTFGEAFLASANNAGADYDTGLGALSVHQALLGDPTLRLFVTRPPGPLRVEATSTGARLSWLASPDASFGYHVYRRAEHEPSASRLTAEPSVELSWQDAPPEQGLRYEYRVVAVDLVQTGSGSFFNHSGGRRAWWASPPAEGPSQWRGFGVRAEPPPHSAPPGCGCGAGGGSLLGWGLFALWAAAQRSPQRSFCRRIEK